MGPPRIPLYRLYQQPTYGGEFQGGFDLGNALMQGIAKIRQQQQMDAIANQLLNQANPPRAALVDPRGGQVKFIPGVNAPAGTDPNAPVPTTGTAPATGGLAEYNLRQAIAQQALEQRYKAAQLADLTAKATGTGAYAKVAKPPFTPYQQKQIEWHEQAEKQKQRAYQAEQEKFTQKKIAQDIQAGTDTIEKLTKDFDTTYGKGATQKFFGAYTQNTGSYGNVVNGQFVPDPGGQYFTSDLVQAPDKPALSAMEQKPIKVTELQPYLDRMKLIQTGAGKYVPSIRRAEPVNVQPFSQPGTVVDQSGRESSATVQGNGGTGSDESDQSADESTNGSSASLPMPSSLAEYSAIPKGSLFIDGNNLIKAKV